MPYIKDKQWASKSTNHPDVKNIGDMITCTLCGEEYQLKANIHKKGCPVCTVKRKINHAW